MSAAARLRDGGGDDIGLIVSVGIASGKEFSDLGRSGSALMLKVPSPLPRAT